MNYGVFRWNRTCCRKRAERARFNCEVQRSEKFRSEKVGIKAWIELRPGFAKSFLLLMDFESGLFQLAVVRSRQLGRLIQG